MGDGKLSDLVEQVTATAAGEKPADARYVGLEHIEASSRRLIGTAPASISDSTNGVFEPGDILFGKLRPNLRKSVQVDFGGFCSTDLIIMRAKPGVNPAFAAHIASGESLFRHAERNSIGTGMPRTSWGAIATSPCRVPPLEEQRRISKILDTIDETIQATERVIAKLSTTWAGAIDELLRPGRYPDEAPPSWSKGIVEDFLHLQRGFDITKDAQRFGNVPVVSSSGIASYHDEAKVKGPGVVIGRKGKLGDAHFIPVDYWPHDTSLWVTDFKGNDAEFVSLFLRSLRLERLDAATSVPTLNRNVVHPLKAAIPSLDDQRRIVCVNDEYRARVQAEQKTVQKLISLRAGLAADLLTGRVRTVAA